MTQNKHIWFDCIFIFSAVDEKIKENTAINERPDDWGFKCKLETSDPVQMGGLEGIHYCVDRSHPWYFRLTSGIMGFNIFPSQQDASGI